MIVEQLNTKDNPRSVKYKSSIGEVLFKEIDSKLVDLMSISTSGSEKYQLSVSYPTYLILNSYYKDILISKGEYSKKDEYEFPTYIARWIFPNGIHLYISIKDFLEPCEIELFCWHDE